MPSIFARALVPPDSSFFLLGPRGTGKTTWLLQHFADAPRYDLLKTSESLRLSRDPSALGRECESLPDGSWILIDEVQKVPALLDEVQRLITEKRQRFALCGSSARKLRRGGANLLAGRAEVRHMFPLVSAEIGPNADLGERLRYGMLPMAVDGKRPAAFLKAYVDSYLKEEIQAEALVREIGTFGRFLEVAARMNAQAVQVAAIARDAGVARQTVQGYFQILVDTLLAFWLPAWKAKPAARQILHPKFYLFDPGVARQAAGRGHLEIHPEERGFLLETLLLHEIRAYLHYRELDYPQSYWATRDAAEVDLVVETPRGLVAIEMKSSARWDPRFARGLLRFRGEVEQPVVSLLGVYLGERALEHDGVRVLPANEWLQALWEGDLIA